MRKITEAQAELAATRQALEQAVSVLEWLQGLVFEFDLSQRSREGGVCNALASQNCGCARMLK